MDHTPAECGLRIVWSVTVGSKGQVVIPKDVRETLGIQPGDSLITIVKGDQAVAFVKMEMDDFLAYIREEMRRCPVSSVSVPESSQP